MRVVLLTRTQRPSGLKMAQTLAANGIELVGIVAEKRLALVMGGRGLWRASWGLLRKHGPWVLLKKLTDRRPVPLEPWARAADIPFFVVDDHNGAPAQDILRALSPDLLIVCNTRKLSPDTYRIARRGALNLHLSLLPRYAGLDSVFWALYRREREIGFTIHKVAESLDAGDILYQEKFELADFPREDALYEELIAKGCQAMADMIADFDRRECLATQQDPGAYEYFSWPNARQRRWFSRYERALSGTQPLKILHLITRMVRGGAQENTLATVLGLRQGGWDAVLATGDSDGPEGSLEGDIRASGIPWVKVPGLKRSPSLVHDLRALIWLIRWLRKENILIVHTHTSKAGALGRVAALVAGVPVIVHNPHGHIFHGYFDALLTRMFIGIERLLALKTDRMIALTQRERQEHLDMGIGKADQFVTIPSGVRLEDFNPREDAGRHVRREFRIPQQAKVIGTVARLVPVKGVEHLLNAFKLLSAERLDLYCLIAGDGPQREALMNLASRSDLGDRVIFAGYRRDIPEILGSMDVFVMASLNEGMGRAIVQAGLMQKPIVASAVSGIRDLIASAENGILVPPANAQAMSEAIGRLLRDEALARRLGCNARRSFQDRYGQGRMVEDIRRVYEEVLDRKAIPRNWIAGVRPRHSPSEEYGRVHEKLYR